MHEGGKQPVVLQITQGERLGLQLAIDLAVHLRCKILRQLFRVLVPCKGTEEMQVIYEAQLLGVLACEGLREADQLRYLFSQLLHGHNLLLVTKRLHDDADLISLHSLTCLSLSIQ